MSELSIFLFFLFLFSFFCNNKALTSDFQRFFSFFALDSLHKDREQPFRYGRAVFTLFWGALKDCFT